MDDFTERQWKVIRFALWHFASAARARVNAAAQDKEGRFFSLGAVDAFLKDAQDAEALLTILRAESAGGVTMGASPGVPRRAAAPELVFPDGYCLDPDGRMCIPEGKQVDWDFGYECGYREAMGAKARTQRLASGVAVDRHQTFSQQTPTDPGKG